MSIGFNNLTVFPQGIDANTSTEKGIARIAIACNPSSLLFRCCFTPLLVSFPVAINTVA